MPDTTLSFERILGLAERESGGFGIADEGLRQRVTQVVDWANARGPYSPDQVRAMQAQLQSLLARRLKMMLDRKAFAGIADETIERPVFIVGFARSGTTLLHSLLAEDPAALAPQSWHILSPSPPPGAMPVAAERIAAAQREVERWMDFCPAQKPMHPYIDKGAHQLIEDEEVAALDFRKAYPYHFYRIPTLDRMLVLDTDERANFAFHREFLQHLQWNTGKRRWACKGPSAQGCLDALFDVYPDALCVWAHRPLGEIFGSFVILSATIYDTITGHPTDIPAFARELAQGMKAGLEHIMANAMIDDPRVMHIPFRDITADPVAAVRTIYERVGETVSPAFEAAITGWMADPENAVDRYGRYPYSYEAMGLDRDWIEELFADYSRRFGLV
jgi:hypothetical protein